MKSKQSCQNTLIKKDGHFETSIYAGELTKECIAKNTIKLMQSFPALPSGFFDVFSDRIKENNYSDKRLTDAINHVIDNCIYPTPTIAQFISYDKRIKLYTHEQLWKLVDEVRSVGQEYKAVRIGDNPRPVWANLNDIHEYNLVIWVNK